MGKAHNGGGRKDKKLPSLKKGASSSNPDRLASTKAKRSGGSLREKAAIKRLKMYQGGRVKRDKQGTVIQGDLACRSKSGNDDITGATGRVQPDRRWFGNTRTIAPTELDTFRSEMREARENPFAVVLRRKKLPVSLCNEVEGERDAKSKREQLLSNEPFDRTFGSGATRKRVASALKAAESGGGFAAMAAKAKAAAAAYEETYEDGADSRAASSEAEKALDRKSRDASRDDLFAKGQSRRIWAELYKVLDCSDVVLHVLDARDPEGTQCKRVVTHIKTQATHKHLVFVLNKCDLVPNWCVRRWIALLGQVAPTLAFRASTTKPFGKGSLIDVLRQFAKLRGDAKQISCGVVGYPNVGKSSVINALRAKAVCKVAPVPGETKIWQYVTLTKRVNLIDCPGVVYDDPRSLKSEKGSFDAEADAVLKGVVRAERLPDPAAFIEPLLARANPMHIRNAYGVDFQGFGEDAEKDTEKFLETLAKKMGRLIKGGEPDVRTVSVQLLNDWQRGKIPHHTTPPEDPKKPPKPADAVNAADAAEEDAAEHRAKVFASEAAADAREAAFDPHAAAMLDSDSDDESEDGGV